jgi:uncharacterized protein YbjT (DUF2867 family)
MKIAVLGATGGTGIQVVKQALEAKHEVIAIVRNPDNLKKIQNNRLTVYYYKLLIMSFLRNEQLIFINRLSMETFSLN